MSSSTRPFSSSSTSSTFPAGTQKSSWLLSLFASSCLITIDTLADSPVVLSLLLTGTTLLCMRLVLDKLGCDPLGLLSGKIPIWVHLSGMILLASVLAWSTVWLVSMRHLSNTTLEPAMDDKVEEPLATTSPVQPIYFDAELFEPESPSMIEELADELELEDIEDFELDAEDDVMAHWLGFAKEHVSSYNTEMKVL